MPPKFGTSGLRGLVTELTPDLVADYTRAFLAACETGTGLYVGRDLRASSPRIAGDVIAAARGEGVAVTDCGALPTPALALAAMWQGAASLMVTGSHIPDDRNGLKFYTPSGELTKAGEQGIAAALGRASAGAAGPDVAENDHAGGAFVARYVAAFGRDALAGARVGVYSHSAVGRDLLIATLEALGADVVELGRSGRFIPVDTEAVDQETRAQLASWAAGAGLDAIVSTDGDGDRPMVADASGQIVPGDVLGQITGATLGARVAVTPVSSNTGAEAGGAFARVIRTKIGSPFVIAAMEEVGGKVVGYEANGGFLLGFDADGPAGALPALMTRDSHLPILAPLVAARAGGVSLADLVADQPARFTAADRLQEVPTDRSRALVARLTQDAAARSAFLAEFGGAAVATDTTDGLRITLDTGRIIHLRPSGNAPELRFYAEAESAAAARDFLAKGLGILATHVR